VRAAVDRYSGAGGFGRPGALASCRLASATPGATLTLDGGEYAGHTDLRFAAAAAAGGVIIITPPS
jgi:hypothetical protein